MATTAPRAEPPESVLRLYELTVEMADRVSARRATANSFFLTLQTGLAAVLGAFGVRGTEGTPGDTDRFVLFLAAMAGVILAAAWWLLLRSYRTLNRAKFEVINQIETTHLPIQPFVDEWALLKEDDPVRRRWQSRYAELSFTEQVVPLGFMALYAVLAGYLLAR